MQKVLLISPQPFFQWRGSPIRVGFNVQALVEAGYHVDLLTLPIGIDREILGADIIRVANPLGLKDIAIGPSAPKIFFDLLIFFKGLALIRKNKYVMIHGVEETGIIAVVLARLNGAKAIFEKHSDPHSYKGGFLKNCLLYCYSAVERLTVRLADGVICTGTGLVDQVKAMKGAAPIFHIFDIPSSLVDASIAKTAQIRKELQQKEEEILVCFVGSFAVYQGVELMFAAIPKVIGDSPQVRFVIIGGTPEEIENWEKHYQELGILDQLTFQGKVPPDDLPDYLAAADILLSPRGSGVNTPLKLFDYFKAGCAIVATDIASNKVILNEDNSILCSSDPLSFAEAILTLVKDRAMRNRLAANGRRLYKTQFNFREYQLRLGSCYHQVLNLDFCSEDSKKPPEGKCTVRKIPCNCLIPTFYESLSEPLLNLSQILLF